MAIILTKAENIPKKYPSVHREIINTAKENGDKYSKRIAFELAVKGKVQEAFLKLYQSAVELVTGRQVTYPD